MTRKTAIVLAFGLLLPLAAVAQWVVPRPDCCPRIYDTGRWLGWASAMLENAREMGEPTADQEDIVNCLRSAGLSAEAAYRACSSGVPAWPEWKQKQLWLDAQIAELRHPGNSTKQRWMRWELAASAIDTAYGQWADAISWEKVDGRMQKRRTCGTCFFQLGFDLAGATQAFRQAFAANAARDLQATLRALNRTRLRLKKALIVLEAYAAIRGRNAAVAGCPDFGQADLEKSIRNITLTAPSMTRAGEEMDFVSFRSDEVGRLLADNCVAGGQGTPPAADPARPPQTPPRDQGELSGDWAVHYVRWGGYIGPEWRSRYAAVADQNHAQALRIRFVRRGDEYAGIILSPPSNDWAILPFDAFGKRLHLYPPGLQLLTLRKIGPNHYRGSHRLLGIPGSIADPERAWSYNQNCDIIVFGEAAKLISPSNTSMPQLIEYKNGAGHLLLRFNDRP